MNMRDFIMKNHKKNHEYSNKFYWTFGVSLKTYLDPMFGLDIVKFDEEVIKTEPNKSMKSTIRAKYGKNGVEIITNLLA